MSALTERFFREYAACDPRDRRDALWIVSLDVYLDLAAMFPRDPFPPAELVEVGQAPRPEPSPMMLGVPVWVRRDLPSETVMLDVDDLITRAIKRQRAKGDRHVTITMAPKFKLPPLPPPPDVTARALARKWAKNLRRVFGGGA